MATPFFQLLNLKPLDQTWPLFRSRSHPFHLAWRSLSPSHSLGCLWCRCTYIPNFIPIPALISSAQSLKPTCYFWDLPNLFLSHTPGTYYSFCMTQATSGWTHSSLPPFIHVASKDSLPGKLYVASLSKKSLFLLLLSCIIYIITLIIFQYFSVYVSPLSHLSSVNQSLYITYSFIL